MFVPIEEINYNHIAYNPNTRTKYLRAVGGVVDLNSGHYINISAFRYKEQYVDLGVLNIDIEEETKYNVKVNLG